MTDQKCEGISNVNEQKVEKWEMSNENEQIDERAGKRKSIVTCRKNRK